MSRHIGTLEDRGCGVPQNLFTRSFISGESRGMGVVHITLGKILIQADLLGMSITCVSSETNRQQSKRCHCVGK